jgi:hypothetical protein
MFERFSAGFRAARECWEVLKQDKKLVLFPLFSGLACLVVLASFALPLALIRPDGLMVIFQDNPRAGAAKMPLWSWALLFLFYFCNYFVIYFFNAALIHCALFRFRGMEVTIGDGLRAAFRCLPQILAWALVSATVGVLLKAIESANEKGGQLISWLLGTSWTILTYFVVPVLIVEKVGPFQAIRRSISILRETWGEALGGRVGIGWFLLPFWLLGILVLVVGGFLCFAAPAGLALGIPLILVALVYLAVLGLVSSALETILLSGLYLFATRGEVPEQMDREVLEHAFTAK